MTGNGTFTSPYSPWWNPLVTTSAPSPVSTFVEPTTVPGQVVYSGNNVFFSGAGWRQPDNQGRSFNAIHMSVIPKGPYRGMVLVFDDAIIAGLVNPPGGGALPPGTGQAYQAYAIIDPADAPLNGIRYRNFLVPIGNPVQPATTTLVGMSVFCSGHAWSQYGDLIVAGGTDYFPNPIGGYLLAGGKLVYVFNPREFCYWPGSQVTYYPDAPNLVTPAAGSPGPGEYRGMWVRADDLVFPRWYPTAMLTHRLQRPPVSSPLLGNTQRMVILGGTETLIQPPPTNDMAKRTYEAFLIVAEAAPAASNLVPDEFNGGLTLPMGVSLTPAQQIKVWDGPGIASPLEWLDEYPRCQLISTGNLFLSGYTPRGAWLDHDLAPGSWTSAGSQPGQPNTYSSNWQDQRHDGSTVLFPNLGGTYDTIVRLGGAIDFTGQVTETMESIDARNPSSTWVSAPGIQKMPGTPGAGRVFMNTVLLPTGGVLVLGGIWQNGPGTQTAVYEPTIFENGRWTKNLQPNPTPSQRGYHSTAVLLPDGRVFVGGGNDRDYDYEIFSPPYLSVPANRPVNPVWDPTDPPTHPTLGALILERDTEYVVAFDRLPLGQEFTKAVLMAPCSVTHHSDMHQRYVELTSDAQGDSVRFACKVGETLVPPGIYMLFFVTNTSVSEAIWVMFQ